MQHDKTAGRRDGNDIERAELFRIDLYEQYCTLDGIHSDLEDVFCREIVEDILRFADTLYLVHTLEYKREELEQPLNELLDVAMDIKKLQMFVGGMLDEHIQSELDNVYEYLCETAGTIIRTIIGRIGGRI